MVDVINDAIERLHVTVTRLPGHRRAGHPRRYPNCLRLLVRQLCLTEWICVTVPTLITSPIASTNTTIRTPHRPDRTILRVVIGFSLRTL
jgi:hypothetical protein